MRSRVAIIIGVAVLLVVFVVTRAPKPTPSEDHGNVGSNAMAKPAFKRFARPAAADLAAVEETNTAASSNIFARLEAGTGSSRLTPEQLAEYLRRYGTNAATLLATQDTNYIRLAATMFPDDPRVQYAAITRNLFPEERREWLDRFKQSAPDNAIADYLSAREYLKAGDREQAFKDLANAAGKTHFNDYTLEQVQNMEDAQLLAGRSLVEAKFAAGTELLLPQLAMFKEVAQNLQAAQKDYIAAGDGASAEALAQWGHSLAQHLSAGEGSRTLIGQLVGVAIDRMMLSQLPPGSQPAFLNGTVQQQIDELNAFRGGVKEMTSSFSEMMNRANENEIITYFDRMKLLGEYNAMQWLRNKDQFR